MSSNNEELIQQLQVELEEKLEALKTQGLDEADQTSARTAIFSEFGNKIQAATIAASQTAATNSSSSSSSSHTTTIFAETKEKINLKSMKSEDIHAWADKLKAVTALKKGTNATEAELRSMTTDKERAIITQAFRKFTFADGGESIEGADDWLQWANNEKLSELLKLVFPKTDAQSDGQKLLSVEAFRIATCKHQQHFLGAIADMMLAIHWEERKEEFANMNAQAFTLLKDIILDDWMGKKQATCEVTKQLIADIKARAPSTLLELFDIMTEEGQRLHTFAVDCERRNIPFLPFKRTEKEDKGNEPKKARQEGGGGGAYIKEEKRTQCPSCGKYHLGACDPNRGGKGGGDKSSSSSSSASSSKATPGKYDKYKNPDGGKKKRKLTAISNTNEIKFLQQEAHLNKLSESAYACQYPMKISTSNGKYIDIIALIDTGANAANYISQTLFDRLSDAGYKAEQTTGSVKGGLNVKGQRVDCTLSISFPLQFISEQCSNDSCSVKKCCKLTTINTNLIAKLLPIDYDLIVGLPSIRKLELIKHLPSLFLNENKSCFDRRLRRSLYSRHQRGLCGSLSTTYFCCERRGWTFE